MKPETYLLPGAAAIALLLTSCEKLTPGSTAKVPEENSSPVAASTSQKACPVSGEELGSMGDLVIVEHKGTSVKLCCKSCIRKFDTNPDQYIAKLKTAKSP